MTFVRIDGLGTFDFHHADTRPNSLANIQLLIATLNASGVQTEPSNCLFFDTRLSDLYRIGNNGTIYSVRLADILTDEITDPRECDDFVELLQAYAKRARDSRNAPNYRRQPSPVETLLTDSPDTVFVSFRSREDRPEELAKRQEPNDEWNY